MYEFLEDWQGFFGGVGVFLINIEKSIEFMKLWKSEGFISEISLF